MTRYRLVIEYDGTDLAGWQQQPGQVTVQGLLQQAIYHFCQEEVELVASGRTDAGVHARGQVVHVDLACDRDPYHILLGINQHLLKNQAPVALLSVEPVDSEFHARFDALERRYEYHIIERLSHLVLDHQRAWQLHKPLDIDAMRAAAEHLIGNHDFTSFRASECQAQSAIKTLDEIRFDQKDGRLVITVRARSFLHHQVRNIVGTLSLVGQGKWQPEDVKTALEARDRKAAGPTAPACGLYLVQVLYPNEGE